MKVYDAIFLLKNGENILVCSQGHTYQKYNGNQIMVTFNRETLKDSILSGTITNDNFLKKYADEEFEQKIQWFQNGDLKLPSLCYVEEQGWQKPKIVMINYFSGTMFNTGYGESYIPSYHTKITPLTNEEIENLKR